MRLVCCVCESDIEGEREHKKWCTPTPPHLSSPSSLPLLWFDAILRRVGPFLPAPLLAARAAAHGRLGGARGGGAPARPRSHFIQAAAVYAAAAAVRLGVYLPHRAGVLADAVDAVAAAVRGEAVALAHAARPAPTIHAGRHVMSDHVFLGACLAAALAAEGALLAADLRRAHATRRGVAVSRGRVALLSAGVALCATLFLLLAADMYYTAAYFHARHESLAAVAAGSVAFGGPVAWWLLRGRGKQRRRR